MITAPQRFQRKRVKGWKMPPNTVSVTRPGPYGNPFIVGYYYRKGDSDPKANVRLLFMKTTAEWATSDYTLIETPEQAIEWYKWYLSQTPELPKMREKLRGKNLACWCKEGSPCHGDVLLELANQAPPKSGV